MHATCRYYFGGSALADPVGVERARLVDALVGVSAEVIALGLQQVRRQAVAAVAVVVGQRRGERRDGNAELRRRGDARAARRPALRRTALVKYGASSRFSSFGSASNASLMRSRNTARMMQPPRHSSAIVAVVERPVVLLRRRLQLHEALGVAADLRGVERLPNLLDELPSGRRCTLADGPLSTLLARTRASFSADRQRAYTASVTSVLGTPRSRASWLIHLPVPLAPALSRILSTR